MMRKHGFQKTNGENMINNMIKHWLSVKIQSSPSMRIVQPNRQRKLVGCSFSQDSSIS
jgi:hypothetical protein